jgi:hypothetical protein
MCMSTATSTADDRRMAKKDAQHGAPVYDRDDRFVRPKTCPGCGGLAPITFDDDSHDDC